MGVPTEGHGQDARHNRMPAGGKGGKRKQVTIPIKHSGIYRADVQKGREAFHLDD